MIRGRYPTSHDLTPDDFERMQLEADNVFCRRCGLVEDIAVPMRQHGTLEVVVQGLPLAFHVYICAECGHVAMSRKWGPGDPMPVVRTAS